MDIQNKSGPYNRPAVWASGKAKSSPHEWHSAWSTEHVRRVVMALLSKPTGAGAPVRSWADVRASTSPGRVEKGTPIYGMFRCDPASSGMISSSLKGVSRTEEGRVWDGPGLDKEAFVGASALSLYAGPI